MLIYPLPSGASCINLESSVILSAITLAASNLTLVFSSVFPSSTVPVSLSIIALSDCTWSVADTVGVLTGVEGVALLGLDTSTGFIVSPVEVKGDLTSIPLTLYSIPSLLISNIPSSKALARFPLTVSILFPFFGYSTCHFIKSKLPIFLVLVPSIIRFLKNSNLVCGDIVPLVILPTGIVVLPSEILIENILLPSSNISSVGDITYFQF